MGNLARPGYTASTDGMWPYRYVSFLPSLSKKRHSYPVYISPFSSINRRMFQGSDGILPYIFSYDSCDVGTFPNQTEPDGSGPPAAIFSNASKELYNFSLSWLPGQRAS